MAASTATTTATTTGTLVDGAKAGDEASWNQIVAEYGPRIRGYARARGVPDPDDVTQDVFVAAAARIGDFDGDDESLRSWLFGIAYRQIVNRYRASAKQTQPLPHDLVDGAGSPEDQVVASVEAGEAIAALDVLSDLERDVVLMRVVGELHSKDVAAAVGKRSGNVRVIQSRAMSKLRRELERRGYPAVGVWAASLTSDLVGPISPAQASMVASAATAATTSAPGTSAAAAAGVSAATAAGAGLPAATKVVAAVVTAAVIGGAAAAVTGALPDPAQRWIADTVDRIGIILPHPDDTAPLLDADPLPTLPLGDDGLLDPDPDALLDEELLDDADVTDAVDLDEAAATLDPFGPLVDDITELTVPEDDDLLP